MKPPKRTGMQLGADFRFVRRADLPALTTDKARAALDSLELGSGIYPALLVLASARAEDVHLLLDASLADTTESRWKRLWSLCPTLTRLSRSPIGREKLLVGLTEDLVACSLLVRLETQRHRSLRKLFVRLSETLVPALQTIASTDEARGENILRLIAEIQAVPGNANDRKTISTQAIKARLVQKAEENTNA